MCLDSGHVAGDCSTANIRRRLYVRMREILVLVVTVNHRYLSVLFNAC